MSKPHELDHEKFNHFVFSIDDTLEMLIVNAAEQGFALDHSEDSLETFENYILKSKSTVVDDLAINIYSQYVGEVFRKSYGGKWKIGDNPASDLDFNLPVIGDFNDVGYVFNPILIVRNFIIRQQRGLFKRAFEAQAGKDRLAHLRPEVA
jgi:hypothetical protein